MDESDDDAVRTTVELSGPYEEVASILRGPAESSPDLDPLVADAEAVLEIVARLDGATKSRIAEAVSGTTADYDADAVIHLLRVLERYDLVVLDGNTWRPGPALSTP